ncbi:MAG: hydantoinase/oxoprolinase family protein, partial [Proteobacteria bacterium]|nr:hydantoinase/oxoprolinase family protein [Pseudomonadota bacterium]
TAVINAYIHAKLARLLYKAGEGLRAQSFPRVLFIGHNNGAAARVAKTRPINTYNSGPTAGMLGARAVGALYGLRDVVSTDMGGTSFDIGLIRDGRAEWSLEPDVEGFACNLPMQSIRALGAGGGSIATVVDGQLNVGPRSAGAYPGPACFDRGGVDATVTDANLVLGLIDPDFFLGGRQKLSLTRAREAIEAAVARPLGIGVEEAALRIRDRIDRIMGDGVIDALREAGKENLAIVAYGGAGPLHSCAIAERSGIATTIVTPFSAVFSAFSSSLMDVGHVYFRRLDLSLDARTDAAPIQAALQSMLREAERDMRGEGFALDVARFEVHAFFSADAGRGERVVRVPLGSRDEALTPAKLLRVAQAEAGGTEPRQLSSLALMVSAATPHIDLRRLEPPRLATPRAAGRRQVYTSRGWVEVPVLDMQAVNGAPLQGPVLLESAQTTLLVAEGFQVRRDEHANLLVRRDIHESRANH